MSSEFEALGMGAAALPGTLRVMTYNINAGRYHADGLEAVARVIAAAAPDVAGLQEVDRHALRTGGVDQAEWLAARLNMQAVLVPPSSMLKVGSTGLRS